MPDVNPNTVPYPPGPDPEALSLRLTAVPRGVRVQESLLLAGQLLYLAIYIALIAGCSFAVVWLVLNISECETLEVIAFGLGIVIGLSVIAFLVISLLRRPAVTLPAPAIEATIDGQPAFLAFLQRVCDDVGADFPRKVFFTAEVNAAVVPQLSLVNLVKPPRHDLYVGLGLVNAVNLSEFQAVLAHELGHFGESGPVGAWARGVEGVIERFFAGPRLLQLLHRALTATKTQLVRQREFHADRVAASVAGSNAVLHALLKVQFADETWSQALADLQRAAEYKHYSADLYYHQHAAAEYLRFKSKDPRRGQPPEGNGPLFDPALDEPGEHHPGQSEREANLRANFVPAAVEERSSWLLIGEANAIRRRMTAEILRTWPCVPANASLTEPRLVQKLLDDERADATYDLKYQGAYDDRPIRLQSQELIELLGLMHNEPWSEDRLRRVHGQLYQDMPMRVARRAAASMLRQRHLDRPRHEDGRYALERLRDLDDRLDRNNAWFHAFDRRVALVHWQMAAQLDEARRDDIVERYRFHIAIAEMAEAVKRHGELVRLHARLIRLDDPRLDLYLFGELVAALRAARASLAKQLRTAGELDLPAMRHFDECEKLPAHLLDEPLLPDLPAGPLRKEWIRKLLQQLDRVHSRVTRLQAKSLSALLRMQDQIAAEYCSLTREVDLTISQVAALDS
jgi:Zn-dependent protease with chaperone function